MSNRLGLSRYLTFGLREEWFKAFLELDNKFWSTNKLGPMQIIAFKNYLKDIELLDNWELIYFLKIFYNDNKDTEIWGITWINLVYNSNLFLFWAFLSEGKYNRGEIINNLKSFYNLTNNRVC